MIIITVKSASEWNEFEHVAMANSFEEAAEELLHELRMCYGEYGPAIFRGLAHCYDEANEGVEFRHYDFSTPEESFTMRVIRRS